MVITKELLILAVVWCLTLAALFRIPAKYRKEAQAVFLFQQVVSWFLGILVVEAGWISYPVREFSVASSTSFTFEFIVYPSIAVYYNLYYPVNSGPLAKLLYGAAYALAVSLPEYWLEKYTQLILYIHWEWYVSFVSILMTLPISRVFYLWFFRRAYQ